jgi:hypothetical protein
MIEEITKLTESQNQLAQDAYKQNEPLVNKIMASQCKDVNQICYTMDCMLDFCLDDPMLLLYRQLCKYLYTIDENAAISYVNAYRERWDEEGVKFGNKQNKMEVI